MDVLIFNGSPRKKGNTALLLEKVAQGIVEAGGRSEQIDLARLSIHPCTGCGHCDQTGECIFDDDMTALYHKIREARRIIIGSPIYFYSVTAQTKLFVDRCQTLWSRKYLLGQKTKYPVERKGYLVSVGATSGTKLFDGTILTVRYAFDAMDFNYCGELLIKGVDKKGAVAGLPDALSKAAFFGQGVCED